MSPGTFVRATSMTSTSGRSRSRSISAPYAALPARRPLCGHAPQGRRCLRPGGRGAPGPAPRHSVSVAGIVTDDQGRVLLVRRADTDEWEPPGGVVERDEDLLSALVREVREETGLTVTPGRLTGVYKNMALGIVALVFRCTAAEGSLRTGHESRA